MFEVSPWEVETRNSGFDQFQTIEWNGNEWQLASCSTDRFKQIRFKREDGPLLSLPIAFQSKWHEDKWEVSPDLVLKTFTDFLQHNKWMRYFLLQNETELRLEGQPARFQLGLSPQGQGYWHDTHAFESGAFFWSGSSDFLMNASAPEVLERLQKEPTKSRFAYARAFLDFDEDKRWEEIWQWRNGNREMFRRLLAGALLAQEELWRDDNYAILTVDFMRHDDDFGSTLALDEGRTSLTPALRGALQLALGHFGPHINTAKVKKHLCLSELLKRNPWVLKIDPQPLTAHERIEAALAWREWLAKTQG